MVSGILYLQKIEQILLGFFKYHLETVVVFVDGHLVLPRSLHILGKKQGWTVTSFLTGKKSKSVFDFFTYSRET